MSNQQESTLDALASRRLFVIPDYQRPYAWEKKQLEDLWADLDLLGERHHYAGTIVLRQHRGPSMMSRTGTPLTVWDVVDGQQRLTTTFLLLDRLRRAFQNLAVENTPAEHTPAESAPEIAAELRATYGVVKVRGVDRPKIQLGSDLNKYWQDAILGDQAAGVTTLVAGQRRLRDAAVFFDRKIGELVGPGVDESFGRLVDLMRRVTDGLRFLVYEVESAADVGVIFETLNDRGLGLTEMEKIKNYLLYLSAQIGDDRSEHLTDVINHGWSNIVAHLAQSSRREDQILRAHWIATHQPDSRRWARTGSIKESFPRAKYVPDAVRLSPEATSAVVDHDALWDTLVGDITTYVGELDQSALFISELHNPHAHYVDFTSAHDRVRANSAALVRTGTVATFYPLLIAARLRHPSNGEFYADLVSLCEKYAARVYRIGGYRSNTGESALNHMAYSLYDGRAPEETAADLETLTWRYADDDFLRSAMDVSYRWYPGRSHRYFLYEYERSLARAGDEVPDYAQFTRDPGRTTEHVLPQTPAQGSQWWRDFSTEEHERLVHSLGNLVLTRDNSVYSNKDFADKRGGPEAPGRCYYTSTLAQEREIGRYAQWTPASIEERQRHLTEWALSRWHINRPGTGDVVDLEDDLGEDALVEESEEDTEADDSDGAGGNE